MSTAGTVAGGNWLTERFFPRQGDRPTHLREPDLGAQHDTRLDAREAGWLSAAPGMPAPRRRVALRDAGTRESMNTASSVSTMRTMNKLVGRKVCTSLVTSSASLVRTGEVISGLSTGWELSFLSRTVIDQIPFDHVPLFTPPPLMRSLR